MSKIFFRPTIFFVIASIVTFTLHELSHAITARLFEIPGTLFAFYANISRTTGTTVEQAIISAIGPSVSLVIGLACLFAFRRLRDPALNLLLLYTGTFSTSVFLGNLFSASMAGDFHRALRLLGCPLLVMQAVTVVGLLALIWFMFSIGKRFINFRVSLQATVNISSLLLVPWLLGTALTILIYFPLPSLLVGGLITSSLFWIPSIIGAWKFRTSSQRPVYEIKGIAIADLLILVCCIVLVRLLQIGIVF